MKNCKIFEIYWVKVQIQIILVQVVNKWFYRYVLGGFDGNMMIPSVEIYDPRRGSWVMGEPMDNPRGFSAAAVVKESIYIFGGLKSGEEINDTVSGIILK